MPDMQPMRIATILPISCLGLDESDYHMCLAHLMGPGPYRDWFAQKASAGEHVLMDNGSAECGVPLPAETLFDLAADVGVTEMTLPDVIWDSARTRELHLQAAELAGSYPVRLMAIPQGRTRREWVSSAEYMLEHADALGIGAIGVSKFQHGVWADRAQAILSVPGLVASDLDIHLLGCWGDDPTEAFRTAAALPDGRVRGIDSGIAAIYAQNGHELMRGPSSRGLPGHHLDFTRDYDPVQRGLLVSNIQRWKRAVRTGV